MVFATVLKLNYGGTNAFTGSNNVQIYYTTAGTAAGLIVQIGPTSFTGTTNKAYTLQGLGSGGGGNLEANSISVTVATANPAGNAAGDNTVTVGVWYQNVTVT